MAHQSSEVRISVNKRGRAAGEARSFSFILWVALVVDGFVDRHGGDPFSWEGNGKTHQACAWVGFRWTHQAIFHFISRVKDIQRSVIVGHHDHTRPVFFGDLSEQLHHLPSSDAVQGCGWVHLPG